MSVLVVIEGVGGRGSSDSLGLLAAARPIADQLSLPLIALAVGDVGDASALPADRVFAAESAAASSQALADALGAATEASDARYILVAASILASDAAACTAARRELGIVVDAVELHVEDGALVTRRAGLRDSVLAHCAFTSDHGIVIVRSGTFAPVAGESSSAPVESLAFELSAWAQRSRVVGHETATVEGPDIAEADALVAGGRGLGSADGFRLAEELAGVLGGAVASTRAVVDAGWYPYSTQVGQTGKTVAPKLYIALGISGAIQHKVGMQGSGTIVAINKDGNAPIHELADLAVVGDLHKIVPELIERLKAR